MLGLKPSQTIRLRTLRSLFAKLARARQLRQFVITHEAPTVPSQSPRSCQSLLKLGIAELQGDIVIPEGQLCARA